MGPEVTQAAMQVLVAAAETVGVTVELTEYEVGWAAVRSSGSPLPSETLEASREADAVFLGAVGHPEASTAPSELRPEAGLLRLRSELGCHTNLRPLKIMDSLASVSPLQEARVRGVDLMIVRELSAGLYYGLPRGRQEVGGRRSARNTLSYDEGQVARVAKRAFELAGTRRGHLVSVDKANVLEASQLWREVVEEVAQDYPAVVWEHMLVDRAAMELVLRPHGFDVLLTENMFGDILSDEAAGVAGSLGLLPSASVGGVTPLFEPVHGSAPDIAGLGKANPTGAILSAAMLLEHALGLPEAARAVEDAVALAYAGGARTADVAGSDGETEPMNTLAFTGAVLRGITDAFQTQVERGA